MYKTIINFIESRGYESLVSGETARDLYRGVTPNTHTISVKTTFDKIKASLKDYVVNEDRFGSTLTVNFKNNAYLIKPLRGIKLDHSYCSYYPCNSFEEESRHLNFTIDSLYYNPINDSWLNFNNAKHDIDNKIIRLVGDPKESILKSKITLLRGPVLAGILGDGWTIDSATHNAMREYYLKLTMAHTQQIKSEMLKLFNCSDAPSKVFNILKSTKVLEVLLPELMLCIGVEQSNKGTVGLDLYKHIMYAVDSVSTKSANSLVIRLAALLHDIAKPHTEVTTKTGVHFYSHEIVGAMLSERILFRWGFPKSIINKVSILVRNHLFDAWPGSSKSSIKKLLARVGPENIHDLIDLRIADRKGTGRKNIKMGKVFAFREIINKELDKISPKDFKLTLKDNEIIKTIQFTTDLAKDTLPYIKDFLKYKVLYGRLLNKPANLKRAVRDLNKIRCPLDKPHLFNTWTSILKDRADTFEDGKLKCGVYCEFICDKKRNKK